MGKDPAVLMQGTRERDGLEAVSSGGVTTSWPRRFDLAVAALLYLFGGVLVLLGGYVLSRYVTGHRCPGHYFGYTSWLSNWDGQWYQYIAEHGYRYEDAGGYGPEAFFPLYPLLGRTLAAFSPFYGQLPLIVVSWAATCGFCLAWLYYARARLGPDADAGLWGLALVLLWPASYFLRAAYTEAVYLLLLTTFFLGCARRWPVPVLIGITGLVTATRPMGALACVALAGHLFVRYRESPMLRRLLIAGAAAAVSGWGLYLYMTYLNAEFGNPLAFVARQVAWNYGQPADVFLRRWPEMASLRPAWGFLVDGGLRDVSSYSWNLQNRAMWLVSLLLIGTGVARRWLSAEEIVFCVLTVALVYVANAPKNMESVGRYLATLVPLYLVMTRLLVALPVPARVGLLGLSGALLAIQSAHFSLWHCVW